MILANIKTYFRARCLIALFSIFFFTGKISGNPLIGYKDFPDPTVIQGPDGKYYAYATQGNGVNIQGAFSSDMIEWTYYGQVFQLPSWANRQGTYFQNTWAPDVKFHDGNYYMYLAIQPDYQNGQCIAVAVSQNPLGPFKDARGTPLICGPDGSFSEIDPMMFDDPKTGKIYLVWGSGFMPIRLRELQADRIQFEQDAITYNLIYPADKSYQHLVEGPWIQFNQQRNYYYLYFSGDACCGSSANYAVMVARSRDITGPYESYYGDTSIILKKSEQWFAPGHNSICKDINGQEYMFYHAIYLPSQDFSTRELLRDKILYTPDDWPYIENFQPGDGQ